VAGVFLDLNQETSLHAGKILKRADKELEQLSWAPVAHTVILATWEAEIQRITVPG
jgi:hypothetical protein